MDTQKVLEVVALYRKRLENMGVKPVRMDENSFFETNAERLSHAHYLLDGIEVYAKDPEKKGKTGRHLGSVQAILWECRIYTLKELKDHNRPD